MNCNSKSNVYWPSKRGIYYENTCILNWIHESNYDFGRRFNPSSFKICVYIPKASVLDIDVLVAWISKRKLTLPKVWRSRYIGHQLMIPYMGRWRTKGIHKRQIISDEEKSWVSLSGKEFSITIQLEIKKD